ncbi:MAG: ABC transporter permease [Spirochaetaceae bacterium 4572_59]|nr:MAG: ABC transporter permease [Spirochaetaceae bacterium 4572_59]
MKSQQKRIKHQSVEKKQARWGIAFVIPSLVFFSLFNFYPIINAFYTSFFKKKVLSLKPPTFIGIDNYVYLIQSSNFWNSIRATVVFTLGTFIPLLVSSLLFAVLIISIKKGNKFFQIALYAPAVLSSVVSAAIWLLIFDPRGLANQWANVLLNTWGADHNWLANWTMVQISTMLVYFWKYIGYFVIIFIAGLSSIPKSLYEAAQIDGTNSWQEFWQITLPLLKPTVVLVSTMSMLQCLKTFGTQYLFTQSGAPQDPINVITMNIYNTGIRDHRIGRASTMSIILFIIMLFFTWLQFKTSKSDDVEY